jgi:diadenosine tetraphosphate (Ap4A) HIT family hydrolase
MPASEWIASEDQWFVVEQCRRCPVPGYLIVRAKTRGSNLDDLSAGAILALGPLLQCVVRSIQVVLRPVRVYVAQFGEEDGDLHFHVFPRTEALTREYLANFPEQSALIHGPMLLDWARERYRDVVPSEETLRALEGLREDLTKRAARQAAAPDGASAP